MSAAAAMPATVERELMGVCKAGLLQLGQQLQQYMQQLHPLHSTDNYDHIVLRALNEMMCVASPAVDSQSLVVGDEDVCNGHGLGPDVTEDIMTENVQHLQPTPTSSSRQHETPVEFKVEAEVQPLSSSASTSVYDNWQEVFDESSLNPVDNYAHISVQPTTSSANGTSCRPRPHRSGPGQQQQQHRMVTDPTAASLLLAARRLDGGSIGCPVKTCLRVYSGSHARTNLLMHIKMKHTRSTPTLYCPYCSYKTERRNDLTKHVTRRHPMPK